MKDIIFETVIYPDAYRGKEAAMNLQEYFRAHYSELLEAADLVSKEGPFCTAGRETPDGAAGRRRESLGRFIRCIMGLVPNQEESGSIITMQEYYDALEDGMEPCVTPYVYRIEDIRSYEIKTQLLHLDARSMTDEEVMSWCGAIKDSPFITPWGYWMSPWEDWLGLSVCEKNIEEHGIVRSLAGIIREMTFNGTTRAQQEERRKETEQAMEAAEDIEEPAGADGDREGPEEEDTEDRDSLLKEMYRASLLCNIAKERALAGVRACCLSGDREGK